MIPPVNPQTYVSHCFKVRTDFGPSTGDSQPARLKVKPKPRVQNVSGEASLGGHMSAGHRRGRLLGPTGVSFCWLVSHFLDLPTTSSGTFYLPKWSKPKKTKGPRTQVRGNQRKANMFGFFVFLKKDAAWLADSCMSSYNPANT